MFFFNAFEIYWESSVYPSKAPTKIVGLLYHQKNSKVDSRSIFSTRNNVYKQENYSKINSFVDPLGIYNNRKNLIF